jgi:hypothetical protein
MLFSSLRQKIVLLLQLSKNIGRIEMGSLSAKGFISWAKFSQSLEERACGEMKEEKRCP